MLIARIRFSKRFSEEIPTGMDGGPQRFEVGSTELGGTPGR